MTGKTPDQWCGATCIGVSFARVEGPISGHGMRGTIVQRTKLGLFVSMALATLPFCGSALADAGVHTAPITYSINGEQYVAVFAGGNSVPYSSPPGDNLWAFKLGGTVAQAATPTTPPIRQPITAAAVAGSAVSNTVTLGRTSATSAESTTNQNAMFPQNLTVPVGTVVTFVNPATNTNDHCADSFFEHEFDSGVLKPGQTFSHSFNKPGEYFYNDCVWPHITGKVVVQ
jgi:plastocyanin